MRHLVYKFLYWLRLRYKTELLRQLLHNYGNGYGLLRSILLLKNRNI